MTRWPLLLPSPAMSTSPSRLRRSSSSIIVKSPSRRSSPSSCRRAVHRRQFAIALPIAVHRRCALGPSPPRSRCPSPWRSRRAPSLAVEEPSRRPSPSRSRRADPRHRGAVAPSIAVEEPSRRTSPSRSRRPCRLTTPATRLAPPSLLSGWLSRCLSSRRRLPSAGALHCGHCLSCLSSVRLVVASSPRFSRRHLPSAGASASHHAVASCHAHLRPLVRLVKASPLLTPPPPIYRIIESSQRSGLMLV
jgi:hypothetical protein